MEHTEQGRDPLIGLALAFLILSHLSGRPALSWVSIALLVLCIAAPKAAEAAASYLAKGLRLVGSTLATVSLSLIYFLVVVPVGLFYRLRGKDELRIKAPPKDTNFKSRDEEYVRESLEKPW